MNPVTRWSTGLPVPATTRKSATKKGVEIEAPKPQSLAIPIIFFAASERGSVVGVYKDTGKSRDSCNCCPPA